ncbi:MAG: hypothetical protein ABMA01_02910 [Chthoniobacteraceae bacterium]
MARKKHHEEELPFVALMDTMTNVVGVLIIVLVMVGIGLAQSVRKVLSDLPPVTPEEHAKLKEEVKEKDKTIEELKAAAKDAKQINEQLEKANAEYALLDSRRPRDVKMVDIDTLKKNLSDKEKALAAEKEAMAKMLADQERMQALLAATPVPVPVAPQPAKVVRIPNARPVPEKAKFSRVLVAGGQLYVLDLEAAERMVMAAFNSAKTTLEAAKAKDAKGKTLITYDQDKVVKFFEKRPLSLPNVTITVPYSKTSTRLAMRLTPKPGQGEPVELANRLNSRFYLMLRQAKTSNSVVWFHVARDSFESYIRAREVVDQVGVAAGWEIASTPAYAITLTEFTVTQMEKPPDVPPPDPNAPVIAAPKKALD